jgi:hypothetical protein
MVEHGPRVWHRRDWLRAAIGAVVLPGTLRADDRSKDDAAEIDALARKAGLGKLGRTETEHFFGIGDASGEFRTVALGACEALASEFVNHFHKNGFADLAMPKGRMTVVILADAKSYAAYTGQDQGLAYGGHFELDTNRLVMFDYRANQAEVNVAAERINTFTLIHETTHQLSFNTGLLELKGDVPLCISEGLATYSETWRPKGNGKIGQVNFPRLKGLTTAWIPLPRLIVDDELLRAEKTQQTAYAESWVLVHAHMKNPARLARFRAYLAAIKGRENAKLRREDARQHLGDLDKLDADLRRYAKKPVSP